MVKKPQANAILEQGGPAAHGLIFVRDLEAGRSSSVQSNGMGVALDDPLNNKLLTW